MTDKNAISEKVVALILSIIDERRDTILNNPDPEAELNALTLQILQCLQLLRALRQGKP